MKSQKKVKNGRTSSFDQKKKTGRKLRHRKKRQSRLKTLQRIYREEQKSCLGNNLLKGLSKVLSQHFPDLEQRLDNLPDERIRKTYKMSEIIFAAIMLYVLQGQSRHGMNQNRKTAKFKHNYERAFKLRLPHMDTVTAVLEHLAPSELEKISIEWVKRLLDSRIFHRHRLLNKYHTVAVDATGYASYQKEPNWPCPYKTYKNDKVTWVQPILCAKLVLPNGLCIPLLTEWVMNEEAYEKQDCELKAFKRLAKQLKTYFPRLPICILADGLYANGPFFDICKTHDWSYAVVLKDTQLKDIWDEVAVFNQLYASNQHSVEQIISTTQRIYKDFRWINDLTYQEHTLSWLEGNIDEQQQNKQGQWQSQKHRFVFVTNLGINKNNAEQVVKSARLRWKIENEGFNAQKNGGYKLKHKISRTNFKALQNFHLCLQLGHLINQLLICSRQFKQIQGQFTLKHCWKVLNAFLLYALVLPTQSNKILRYP